MNCVRYLPAGGVVVPCNFSRTASSLVTAVGWWCWWCLDGATAGGGAGSGLFFTY